MQHLDHLWYSVHRPDTLNKIHLPIESPNIFSKIYLIYTAEWFASIYLLFERFSPMEEYIGKSLRIKTDAGLLEGKMCSIDAENGILVVENNSNRQEVKFGDIANISLADDEDEKSVAAPLKESDMYMLLYEAFNVFGPLEDHFIYTIACSLKKFLKDIATASIKIIIGSDDIFGRIGLSFARLVLDRAQKVSIELRCDIYDVNTIRYKSVFENSGGCFNQYSNESVFTLILFAANRNFNFCLGDYTAGHVLLLDIPSVIGFQNFTGLGLGFIPEHFANCNKFYYLIDVGFGKTLAKKYKLPQDFKNSLVKIEVYK
ncbi:uncharacterized protein VICG_01037 [Vittaforma corneae ATCC 50505]|uniref:DUF5096 domain-containing protein n=1 Tax=Vittaforma corneae (strain ATCC 50505) TaxID=993615 RepID=L2GLT5_VITCO|nr:uncharacterized protein VICG_01037 [Vittaforma corneae ATCC 50505]ELA41853.1 hypothetical protein VICG_01037 [Vittaforma corneae ATCC 50505]